MCPLFVPRHRPLPRLCLCRFTLEPTAPAHQHFLLSPRHKLVGVSPLSRRSPQDSLHPSPGPQSSLGLCTAGASGLTPDPDPAPRYAMKCLDKKRIKMKQGETLALNERIMLSLVSTGVSWAGHHHPTPPPPHPRSRWLWGLGRRLG